MESKDLIVSERDKNKYEFIELENGLRALLIQDIHNLDEEHEEGAEEDENLSGDEGEEDNKESQQEEEEESSRLAAVALSVSAGCLHEQRDCNGIAHFLEHMCFMGSEKYPNENEFDNLLTKHGGYSNAFTDIMNTNYQFSVSAKHLKKMLDIFAHFFIDPLLKPDSVNREIEAIQNEFQTSLTSQAHRFQQLFMYFVQTPEVRGRFLMGSSESILGPRPSPEAKAQESEGFTQGMKHLHSFFDKNYDPRAMRLVVSSSAPLEELKAYVTESFSSIPYRTVPHFNWKSKIPFITQDSAKQIVLFESTKTDTILYLIWGFPCSGVQYRTKSTSYLANLIGHQAKGSLLFLLKKSKYASTLSAYTEESMNVISHLLYVQIKLTEEGLKNLTEVISLIFSYIAWLQQLPALPSHLFQEVKQMKDIKFKFLEKQDPFDQVTDIAQKWTFLQDSDRYLLLREKEECYSQLNHDEIKDYLNHIQFQTTKLFLSVPKLFQKATKLLQRDPDRKITTHQFYKVQVVEASRDLLLVKPIIQDPTIVEKLGASVPIPNPYIPTDFQSVNQEYQKMETEKKFSKSIDLTPQIIFQNQALKLYYSLDQTFKMPTSVYSFVITLDQPRSSPKHNALFYLFVRLLDQDFNINHGYYGDLAKADYQIQILKERCIYFKVEGYMHNLDKFVLHFFQKLKKMLTGSDIDLDLLQVQKEQMLKKRKNSLMSGTYLADKIRVNLYENDTQWIQRLLAEIQNSNQQDFLSYITQNLSVCSIHVTAFYYGCLGPELVKSQTEEVLSPLKSFSPLNQPRKIELKNQMSGLIPKSPQAIKEIRLNNRNLESQLSTCIVSFSLLDTFPDDQLSARLTMSLLNHLMSQRCFNELRTKQALGYTVYSTHWRTRKVLGVQIVVESAKYDPDYLQNRIKEFLVQFIEDLEKKKEIMKQDMQGLADQLQVPYNKVSELTEAVWTEIIQDSLLFNIKSQLLKMLNSLNYQEFVKKAKLILLNPLNNKSLNAQVIKVYSLLKGEKKEEFEKTPIEIQLQEIKTNYVKWS